MTESKLLNSKICDLPLHNVEGRLSSYKKRICHELRSHGISWQPHLWVSEDWFCPDGVPGFAVPFYLFNDELMSLEEQKVGYVEGKTDEECLKLFRHELGHAIDNAFAFRKNKERQRLFGASDQPYPKKYFPRFYSKKYVDYLGDGYGQSHPDEDFAETFAVWLDGSSQWRDMYEKTPVYEKLLFMDQLMKSLPGREPVLKNRYCIEPWTVNKETLRAHYTRKRRQLKVDKLSVLDTSFERHLKRESFASCLAGSSIENSTLVRDYLALHREKLARDVSMSTGEYKYLVNRAITITIKRAEDQRWTATKGVLAKASCRLIQQNLEVLRKQDLLDYYL